MEILRWPYIHRIFPLSVPLCACVIVIQLHVHNDGHTQPTCTPISWRLKLLAAASGGMLQQSDGRMEASGADAVKAMSPGRRFTPRQTLRSRWL